MSPFASLTNPPSGEFSPVAPTRTHEPRRGASPLAGWMWLLLVVALLIAGVVGVWLAFSAAREKPESPKKEPIGRTR